jgi:NitT/TauT family transport system substrate-binding protein
LDLFVIIYQQVIFFIYNNKLAVYFIFVNIFDKVILSCHYSYYSATLILIMSKQLKTLLISVSSILVIALITAFAFNATNSKLETTKVKIGYVPVSQSLPLYLALEKGYFTSAGLEIEPIKFEAPNLYADAIVSGQIDFSANSLATGIMSIVETKNPGTFQIYGTNYADVNNAADVIVVPKDSTAATFADLKGKTCVTLDGPQFKTIFTKLAKDAGLKASEQGKGGDIFYKELPVTELVTALGSKTADCIVGLDPAGTVAVNKGIGKLLGTSPISQAFGGKFYGGVSAVNTTFKSKNPTTTSKVVEIMDKATAEIQKDPQAAKQYLPKYLGIPAELVNSMKVQSFRSSTDLDESDFVGIDNFLNEFQAQGVYPVKPDFRKLKYTK